MKKRIVLKEAPTTIREKIILIMWEYKLNQYELSKSLNVSQTYISALINNKTKPNNKLVQGLISVYNVDKQWIKRCLKLEVK